MQYTWLTQNEVDQLIEQYGPNQLPEKKPPTEFEIFISQLKSPLVYVLLVAAVITFILDQHEDTIIIWLAVFINTVLWYYQESKAWKALEALKALLQAKARVIRDGEEKTVATEDLVPWDLVLLKAGEKIPADGHVIEANRFFAVEAMLTWESDPLEKKPDDTVFMWTIAKGGHCMFQIDRTGEHTEVGKIAMNVQGGETQTPLQKQLEAFSKWLSILVLSVTLVVFVVGLLRNEPIVDIFTTAVALAVSAIPEGLLVALTVVLTIWMQKILKRKWLVKNLVSAETLGGVTVICSDKTWTLTHGVMRVEKVIWDGQQLAQQATLANDHDNAVALATAERWEEIFTAKNEHTLIDSIPFSSENKFTAALYESNSEKTLYVNGAPEYVIEWTAVNDEEKQKLIKEVEELTSVWYRVIWYARKSVNTDMRHIDVEDCRKWLDRVWILWLIDPVREDVKAALKKTHTAWVKLIVITWDYAKTAKYIMHQLDVDVDDKSIILGTDLKNMTDDQLDEWLEHDSKVKLFARTQPEQKMRIVNALKRDGEVVAMMGDGVNDAPALKKSDIGIVVWEATDVAKESADLILLDSSFSTIVGAVEEWRSMFDNIRKVILYLMCDAFIAILVILFAIILWYPLPLAASQILWINLVSDGFPNLALTVDPARKGLMNKPPRSPKEPLVASWINKLIALVSILWWIGCFLIYLHILHKTNDLELARSVTYVTCGINSLFYVYSIRTLWTPIWKENPFNNKRLNIAVLGWFAFLIAPFVLPGLGKFLSIVQIWWYWLDALGIALFLLAVVEMYKHSFRKEFNADQG